MQGFDTFIYNPDLIPSLILSNPGLRIAVPVKFACCKCSSSVYNTNLFTLRFTSLSDPSSSTFYCSFLALIPRNHAAHCQPNRCVLLE